MSGGAKSSIWNPQAMQRSLKGDIGHQLGRSTESFWNVLSGKQEVPEVEDYTPPDMRIKPKQADVRKATFKMSAKAAKGGSKEGRADYRIKKKSSGLTIGG